MTNFALIQSNIVENDISQNHKILTQHICEACQLGATVLLLPEMFNTGFTFPNEELAQNAHTSGLEFMAHQAQQHRITLIGSLPNLDRDKSPRPFNTLYVVNPSGITASYSKIHLFSYSGENSSYSAGDQTSTVHIEQLQVSLFICYDLRFANVFFDLAPSTDVYVVVANWPSSRQMHWETLLRARAIENLAYVVGVNRVGMCGKLQHCGASQVISPFGEIIAHAGSEAGVTVATITPDLVKKTRDKFPFLNDRRKTSSSCAPSSARVSSGEE